MRLRDYQWRNATPVALRSVPYTPAGAVATYGDEHVLPFRPQHLLRQRVGRGYRARRHLQPLRPRLPPMGSHSPGCRHAWHHPHRKAPRRLLPVAQPSQHPHHCTKQMAQRSGRCAARPLRRLSPRGLENGGVHLPVGPQRTHLRHPSLQRNLPANPPATSSSSGSTVPTAKVPTGANSNTTGPYSTPPSPHFSHRH